MSDTISIRLPRNLSERLSRLAESTHRPKSFYVREALEEHLGELEWAHAIASEAAAIRRGEVETRPLDELTRELGFDPDELRADARRTDPA